MVNLQVLRSVVIAFSIYSRIPVPQFEWKEEDMKVVLCFFPWVGAVIGVFLYLWNEACRLCEIGEICRVAIGTAVPLFVTGGFHVDGFMDTMDAFHSYQPRERKLEILKDSHVGAFAIIALAAYGLVYVGAFSEIRSELSFRTICCGFFLARCLSGIAVVSFRLAKKEGSLFRVADGSKARLVRAVLCVQGIACIGLMLFWSFFVGMCMTAAAVLSFLYYYRRCRREFGGITGDTAGYFVLLCEVCMVVAAAAAELALTKV